MEDYICVVGRIRTRVASFTHIDLEMELGIKEEKENFTFVFFWFVVTIQ